MDATTSIPGIEYFELQFVIVSNKPKFKIKLKKCYKKPKALMQNSMPVSGSSCEYFVYHLGPEAGEVAYEFRKKCFRIENACAIFYKLQIINDDELEFCKNYFEQNKHKRDIRHAEAMQSHEVLAKIRESNIRTAPARGKKNSEYWKNDEWRKKTTAVLNEPELRDRIKKKFLETIGQNKENYIKRMNDPERIAKISTRAKQYWQSKSGEEKKRLLPKSGYKNYIVNNVKMNKIESIVGVALTSLGYKWEYEKVFDIDGLTILPDFYVQSHNIIIECFGTFWHADPELFTSDQVLYKTCTAGTMWKRDEQKKQILVSSGYRYAVLWEREIMLEDVISIINDRIKNA